MIAIRKSWLNHGLGLGDSLDSSGAASGEQVNVATPSTQLLHEWQLGDRDAGNRLFSILDRELQAIAAAQLRNERSASLASGDLVNEAVLKLARLDRMKWADKAHFLALASRVMRRVLIDRARARNACKRAHQPVTLVTGIGGADPPIELLELNMALEELAAFDSQRAEIVEMRFFGGMGIADIALVLGVSEATAKRRWASARAWLFDRLAA